MNFFEKIIEGLSGNMVEPTAYGLFHTLSFAIMLILGALTIIYLRKTDDKTNKIVLISYASLCLLLEVYKQLVFTYRGSGVWEYRWYAFPFQFCSTPMYVALIAAFLKKGKVQDSLYNFLATYGLIAGLLVMILPVSVFTSTIGINIQTMIHHGGQVLIGLYLIASGRAKMNAKGYLSATATFATLVAIAMLLNVTMYQVVPSGTTFNMFLISPYFNTNLPILKDIQPQVPYILFLIIYMISFAVGAMLVIAIVVGIRKLIALCLKQRNNQQQA